METTTTTQTPHQIMVVGTWVRGKNTNREHYDGKIGKIVEVLSDRFRVSFLNQLNSAPEVQLFLTRDQLELVDKPMTAAQDQVLEAWEARYNFQSRRNTLLQNEFESLCSVIIEVAEDAGYCDEYDKVVEEVNDSMSRKGHTMRLRKREREYEVTVTMSSTITVQTNVTVTASSEEEACDYVEEDPSSFMDMDDLFMDEIRYNGSDADVEEVRVR